VTLTVIAEMFSPTAGSLDHAGWRHAVRQPGAYGMASRRCLSPKFRGNLGGDLAFRADWTDRHVVLEFLETYLIRR